MEEIAGNGELVELDIRYFEPVRRLVEYRRPATIFHLAAQSLPHPVLEKRTPKIGPGVKLEVCSMRARKSGQDDEREDKAATGQRIR